LESYKPETYIAIAEKILQKLLGGFDLLPDAPYTQQLRITYDANLALRRSKTETER